MERNDKRKREEETEAEAEAETEPEMSELMPVLSIEADNCRSFCIELLQNAAEQMQDNEEWFARITKDKTVTKDNKKEYLKLFQDLKEEYVREHEYMMIRKNHKNKRKIIVASTTTTTPPNSNSNSSSTWCSICEHQIAAGKKVQFNECYTSNISDRLCVKAPFETAICEDCYPLWKSGQVQVACKGCRRTDTITPSNDAFLAIIENAV